MTQADGVHSTPPPNTSATDNTQSPAEAPTEALDSFYLPTDISPEEVFQAIGRLRKEARDEIERLLSFLDAIDDPELEDDEVEQDPDQEPSLAAGQTGEYDDQARWAAGGREDLEHEHDGREPHGGDDEPSLCGISVGGGSDGDLEGDDSADAEPSLGAPEAHGPISQTDWAKGDSSDREESLGDDEPSLGWTISGVIGMPAWNDNLIDLEDEHDGAEPDECYEPSLGSLDQAINQVGAWMD